jgi:tripartite-type tricarboxylate transporter receptor subunit TctC
MIQSLKIAVALCAGLFATFAQAQTYPVKPIRIVVPAAPGGTTDILARALGQRLTESWGQPVIVENKPGATNQVAAAEVAKAPADGYTLFATPEGTFVINPSLYKKLTYDPKDFVPVAGLAGVSQGLIMHPSVPAQNFNEFLALARSRPGQLTYAAFGIGTAGHLNMELLQMLTGTKFVVAHYRGAAPALTDVVGGHVNMLFMALGGALQQWKAGRVKVLAVGSPKRLPQFPDLPTIAEHGLPDFEARSWYGLFAPAKTPRDIVDKLNAETARIFSDPAFQQKHLNASLYEPMVSTADEFAAYIKSDAAKWAKVIRGANISVD